MFKSNEVPDCGCFRSDLSGAMNKAVRIGCQVADAFERAAIVETVCPTAYEYNARVAVLYLLTGAIGMKAFTTGAFDPRSNTPEAHAAAAKMFAETFSNLGPELFEMYQQFAAKREAMASGARQQ